MNKIDEYWVNCMNQLPYFVSVRMIISSEYFHRIIAFKGILIEKVVQYPLAVLGVSFC